jgi:hypothetical protein
MISRERVTKADPTLQRFGTDFMTRESRHLRAIVVLPRSQRNSPSRKSAIYNRKSTISLVPPQGFEPRTNRL